jgi:hypothetical protein
MVPSYEVGYKLICGVQINVHVKLHRFQNIKVKGKVVCDFFNLAPRHGGVLGEWRYISTHS